MDHRLIQEFARKRHFVYLRRKEGLPRSEWTDDALLQQFRFTNVYRELDKTTLWMKKNVRDRLKDSHELLLAIVLFRWFNRIETGEAIFCQHGFDGEIVGDTAWDQFCRGDDVDVLRTAIVNYRGKGPYVTGSYIIKTPDGYDKLSGVLQCIKWFRENEYKTRHSTMETKQQFFSAFARNHVGFTLEETYEYLLNFPYLGSFMAAQIVADLKYTPILEDADDWHTFAASGPGSRRGLNIVCGREHEARWKEKEWHETLLELREKIAPMFREEGWEVPHAQDTQNICCEFSKYTRGFSRQKFK